jgi:hypothetical protein
MDGAVAPYQQHKSYISWYLYLFVLFSKWSVADGQSVQRARECFDVLNHNTQHTKQQKRRLFSYVSLLSTQINA